MTAAVTSRAIGPLSRVAGAIENARVKGPRSSLRSTRWCKQVKVVVSDGSKAYKAAIDAHLGHARHVLDRFHVIRWFAAGLTQVRRDIQRREPHGVKPAFDPEVFKARFALLRRGDTLTDADRARLDELFPWDRRSTCSPGKQRGRSRSSHRTAHCFTNPVSELADRMLPLACGSEGQRTSFPSGPSITSPGTFPHLLRAPCGRPCPPPFEP